MNIYQEKKELRKKVRHLKGKFSLVEKRLMSVNVLQKLEESEEFIDAQIIMAYWSMDDEVYTHDFVQKWAAKKRIILPVVNGSQLKLKEFMGVDEMVAGENFSIPEPKGSLFEHPESIDLIIVPGVAFDIENNRMGRGKAYYDQLLRESNSYKIGLCFPFQLFNKVPFDDLDVKMHQVIG